MDFSDDGILEVIIVVLAVAAVVVDVLGIEDFLNV